MTAKTDRRWRCAVCGYVHTGPEPPEVCPVCGAPRDVFELVRETRPAPAPQIAARLKCMVCGYEHEGGQPPEACLLCGAPDDCFEPMAAEPQAAAPGGETRRIVIAGAGIAGLSAAEAARQAAPGDEILLLSKEPDLPYYRLNLTRYLAGDVGGADLRVHPEAWYDEQDIRLSRGVEVSAVDVEGRSVRLSNGKNESFDRLILTAGSHAFVPPIPGAEREGVIAFRTAEDARRILEAARPGARCVCVGGGLLGLETAAALAGRGVKVTMVEGAPWLLPRQLSERGGERLGRHVRGLGIQLLTGRRTEEITGDKRASGVRLNDGAVREADFIVVAAGIRSNMYLARQAGLDVGRGVVVNKHLETSSPHILAAGDIAEHRGVVYGIWPASQTQGRIAGMNAAGAQTEFAGMPRSNTLKVLDLDLVSMGRIEPEDGGYTLLEHEDDARYLRFVCHDNRLVGAILMGDTAASAHAKEAIERRTDLAAALRPGATALGMEEALAAPGSAGA